MSSSNGWSGKALIVVPCLAAFLFTAAVWPRLQCPPVMPARPSAENETVPPLATPDTKPKETKIILFWTKWYQRANWIGFPNGYGPEKFANCPVSNCLTTNNRSLFNQSHVIMFHTQPVDFTAKDLPTYRLPHQRFTMYFFEPLMYSSRPVFSQAPPHFFNWTFTFRRFSDIASDQYGNYRLIANSMDRKVSGNVEREEALDDFYGVNIANKTRMVAWFSSNCQTPILRENLVRELAKYVQVDIYGGCGNLTCSRAKGLENDECDQLLGQNYLFYLSFENSFCPDYVTEKLFRPLRAGVVPIVLGAGHYTRFAPPHSYINALDYETPKELAEHLLRLSQNRKLYAHYFEWRRHFQVETIPDNSWCQLCQMINNDSIPTKSYENIAKWWFDDYPCLDYKWKLKS